MAGNQREMQRRERKAQKDKRNKRIIWIIIAVIVIILVVMKVCEININSIKNRFTNENGAISVSESVSDAYPYNIDASQNVFIKEINSKLGILTPNSFTVMNTKNAATEYTFDHGYSNPIMDVCGMYALIYDQGAKSIRLDNNTSNIYETELEKNINCAAVAKNGTVIYSTASKEKKSDIKVVNKSLKQQLEYSTSYGYVIDVAINSSASKIAFAAVNSENAKLKIKLYTMNVGADEIKEEIDLPDGNLVDLHYTSNNLYVVGDSYIGIVDNQKTYKPVFESGKINTVAFTYTPSNELLLAYGDYTNSTDNTIARVKPNGKIRLTAKVNGNVKSISSSSGYVSVLTNNNIVTFNLGKLEEKSRSDIDDSAKSICQMGSQTYVHRQSLIDRNEAKSS